MRWKGFVRAGLVFLSVVSGAVVSVHGVGGPGAAVILAGDDEPTHPRWG